MTSSTTARARPATREGRWLSVATAVVWIVLTVAWLFDAAGHGAPPATSRALVVLAITAAAALVVRATRRAPRTLLVLVALSLIVRFVGLDFELIDHWYNDEGGFRATGMAINGGQLLPTTFHYGHLLYYLSAFVLWLESLFPGVAAALTGVLFEVPSRLAVHMALLRSLAALCGALTTIPVWVIGRRIAGPAAALVAALLIVFSTLYNSVAHLVISDVPAAFFGALALMFVARLLDGENRADYVLAGVMAALAAACKYPAGLTALAIVGIWVYWRLRRRDLNGLLLLSGAVSLVTFLAAMPALWLRPEGVFVGSGLDILFGFRQYALGGWLGVQPESASLWYARELFFDLGPIALLLGLGGLPLLPPGPRRRAVAMMPFAALYLLLIASMNMVVHRNLQPVLPLLAALVGAGIVAWPLRLAAARPRAAARLFAVAVVTATLWPAVRVLAWDYARTRPGTRQLMEAWIEENVPPGAGIVIESNTPSIDAREYDLYKVSFAAIVDPAELASGDWEYLLLSGNAWGRFQDPDTWSRPHHPVMHERYEQLRRLPEVTRQAPTWNRAGPLLSLHRLPEGKPRYRTRRRFRPADVAQASHPVLTAGGGGEPIRFHRRGQSVVFKDWFESGRYRVKLKTRPRSRPAWLYVAGLAAGEVGTFQTKDAVEVELPARDKYFLRVFLPRRSELVQVTASRLGEADPAAGVGRPAAEGPTVEGAAGDQESPSPG